MESLPIYWFLCTSNCRRCAFLIVAQSQSIANNSKRRRWTLKTVDKYFVFTKLVMMEAPESATADVIEDSDLPYGMRIGLFFL